MTNTTMTSDRILSILSWITTVLCFVAFAYCSQDQDDSLYPAAFLAVTIISVIESIWISNTNH